MEFAANTVLVTGSATGIGFALAERFVKAGSNVIICGRRKLKLEQAQSTYPQFHTRVCNLANPAERTALFTWATGSQEATFGFSAESSRATREQLEAIFMQMNQPEQAE